VRHAGRVLHRPVQSLAVPRPLGHTRNHRGRDVTRVLPLVPVGKARVAPW
jgi:hypothetical protein